MHPPYSGHRRFVVARVVAAAGCGGILALFGVLLGGVPGIVLGVVPATAVAAALLAPLATARPPFVFDASGVLVSSGREAHLVHWESIASVVLFTTTAQSRPVGAAGLRLRSRPETIAYQRVLRRRGLDPVRLQAALTVFAPRVTVERDPVVPGVPPSAPDRPLPPTAAHADQDAAYVLARRVTGREFLHVDAAGIRLGDGGARVPWHDVAAVVLHRVDGSGGATFWDAVGIRTQAPLPDDIAPSEVAIHVRQVLANAPFDHDRFRAAVRHFAPHVPVLDVPTLTRQERHLGMPVVRLVPLTRDA